jgi:threonine dehydrogenase-like Zn-dependent dehydrogenase
MEVYAVDINSGKLQLAEKYGAIPVNAAQADPVAEIRHLTAGKGVDVAIELIGLPLTMQQAVRSLGIFGRAVMVGISDRMIEIDTYHELIGPETEIIGSNDHLLQELPLLMEYARRGVLDLSRVVSRTIPLDAATINRTLDELEQFGSEVRTVIVP